LISIVPAYAGTWTGTFVDNGNNRPIKVILNNSGSLGDQVGSIQFLDSSNCTAPLKLNSVDSRSIELLETGCGSGVDKAHLVDQATLQWTEALGSSHAPDTRLVKVP